MLFDLGKILATPNAVRAMMEAQINPATLLARHVTGDWGNLTHGDSAANDRAILEESRIVSSYKFDRSHKPIAPSDQDLETDAHTTIWIITEADRSVTTFLLPEDY